MILPSGVIHGAEKCSRLLVGSGSDTYDPVCDLPKGHKSICESLGAIDQHRISVRSLSIAWEIVTGADSIPTIERMYDRSESGAYECVWPGCSFHRHDAEAMWRHVHNLRAHWA